jgi:hypothetical protein
MKKRLHIFSLVLLTIFSACTGGNEKSQNMKERNNDTISEEVRLVTLAPGHFHAALVQKSM